MSIALLERKVPNVASLRLNRPEARNALSPQLRLELREHFLSLSVDETCRAIVITGDMRAFAAGADIKAIVDMPLPA